MYITSPLDSASSWLTASNIVYVAGAVLTFGAAVHVLLEKRSILSGRRPQGSFWAEASVVFAAAVSVLGTIGAIHFSNTVSHLKDIDLEAYKTSSRLQIAQANTSAATANQKAQEARVVAAKVEQENAVLGGSVTKNAEAARKAEAELAKANKETSDFAHSLQKQQIVMQEQARVSPILTDFQITQLATVLNNFSGQDVIFHSTADTTVLRLKKTIAIALQKAGITFKQNSMDMGALYQGVSVAVHSPDNVPPLANALVMGLHQAGIDVHPVSAPDRVPVGKVALFLGPN